MSTVFHLKNINGKELYVSGLTFFSNRTLGFLGRLSRIAQDESISSGQQDFSEKGYFTSIHHYLSCPHHLSSGRGNGHILNHLVYLCKERKHTQEVLAGILYSFNSGSSSLALQTFRISIPRITDHEPCWLGLLRTELQKQLVTQG